MNAPPAVSIRTQQREIAPPIVRVSYFLRSALTRRLCSSLEIPSPERSGDDPEEGKEPKQCPENQLVLK